MLQPGRSFSNGNGYRYGFNGKENDNEVKGEGNSIDFGARIYDPRIGRWFSTDPLQKKYAGETPYNYVSGNPIIYIDSDGRDKIVSIYLLSTSGQKVLLYKTTHKEVYHFTYGTYERTHLFSSRHFYKADIEETLVLDATGNIIDDLVKEGQRKAISMADFMWFNRPTKPTQSESEGSYQKAGYIITGNANGSTIDLKDRAGHVFGHIDLGDLLNLFSVSSADAAVLLENFDIKALETVLKGFEKVKATKETMEVSNIVKEKMVKMQEEQKENTLSVKNTKSSSQKQVKTTRKAASKKVDFSQPDSIHVPTEAGYKTVINPNKKKGGS